MLVKPFKKNGIQKTYKFRDCANYNNGYNGRKQRTHLELRGYNDSLVNPLYNII